jgi:hypothetical protein
MCASPVGGQSTAGANPSDPWVELSLTSASLGEREVRVAVPTGYETSTRSYPVLVLLDADDVPQFSSAVTTARFLASRRSIQPLIIVGIVNGADRSHDMTPVGNEWSRAWIPTGGGGDDFLDFISDEVLPMVRERYRTLPYTILAGHSLGGLIGVYAAATRPDAFNAIIAMSPSLQYDGGAVVDEYARAVSTTSTPLRLMTSSGAAEPVIDVNTTRFADMVDSRVHPNLVYEHRRYPYSHLITPILSLTEGLLFVFRPISLSGTAVDRMADPFRADSASFVQAFVATDSTYAFGARTFPARAVGASESLPLSSIREAAALALYSDEPGAGVVIASRGVDLYPESPGAHSALADALLASGDSSSAQGALARMIGLREAADDVSGRVEVEVGEEVLRTYVGEYELSSTAQLNVILANGTLFVKLASQDWLPFFPESESEFLSRTVDAQISFSTDDTGAVTALVLHQNGRDQTALRVR